MKVRTISDSNSLSFDEQVNSFICNPSIEILHMSFSTTDAHYVVFIQYKDKV